MLRSLGGPMGRLPLLLFAGFAIGGCGDATGPGPAPPYLAIVARVDAPPRVDIGRQYTYQVQELSGTLDIDTSVAVAPTDTVILSLPPATYLVTLTGVPAYCSLRQGAQQYVVIPKGINTAIVRYSVECDPQLGMETLTDGFALPAAYIYELQGPGGSSRVGVVGPNETVGFDNLPEGTYRLRLGHVPPHCVVTNDGGAVKSAQVTSSGHASLQFRVVCSDEAARPIFLSFQSSYHDGVSAFVARVFDPTADVERYYWDLTDCQGNSILPNGGRLRRGLSSDRTAGEDTVTVLGAIEVGLPDADLQGRCTALRIVDEPGNTTPVQEEPIGGEGGRPPMAPTFFSTFVGTSALRTTLTASDPDGDFVGVFAGARLRDGILGPPDGQDDIGVFNPSGYLDTNLPDVPLGGLFQYYDVRSIIVYLIDARGNFTRIEDDPFN